MRSSIITRQELYNMNYKDTHKKWGYDLNIWKNNTKIILLEKQEKEKDRYKIYLKFDK